jgi:uncharacterized membrane protein YdbT with pleckstrin-like domain
MIMQITSLRPQQTKNCPFCAEPIRPEAVKCRFCGEYLNTDLAQAAQAINTAPVSEQQTEQQQTQDSSLYIGRPSLWAMAPDVVKALCITALAYGFIKYPLEIWFDNMFKLQLSDAQTIAYGHYRILAGYGLIVLVALVLLLKALKLKMTRYEVTADRIEYSRGILDRRVDNLDMFRVIDLKLRRSILDIITGVGTVELITTDATDPRFTFGKVRRSRKLYDVIKNASLEADNRRSVFHLE